VTIFTGVVFFVTVDSTAAVASLVCVPNPHIRTTPIRPVYGHRNVRLANLKHLMQRHVSYPDVVFSVYRNTVRHVEQVAAPVADNDASSGIQRQDCRDSNWAFGCVLEVVAGIETAARKS
jgi:hypothetical protein